MQAIQPATRAKLAQSLLTLEGQKYSLADYPHMVLPYNINPNELVLHFSRQCVLDEQILNLSSGKPILAKELKPGQYLNSFNEETQTIHPGKVKHVWDNGIEPVYEISTRTGRNLKVTDNHPIWKVTGWERADKLKVGDLIGLSNNNHRSNTALKTVEDWKYKIAAYLLAKGGLTSVSIRLSIRNTDSKKELQEAISCFDSRLILKQLGNLPYVNYIKGIGIGKSHPLKEWLMKENMWGKSSQFKDHPDFIWELTESQIKDYLRIWWEIDGFISKHKNGQYYIGISLISKKLIKGIQELLLKLGIHSTIKTKQLKIYNGFNKYVYRLSIEGTYSKETFFKTIKTFKNPKTYIFKESNNNRLKIESRFINDNLALVPFGKKTSSIIYKQKGNKGYTYSKVQRMLKVSNLPEVEKILNGDLYFDEIVDIRYLGKKSTTAIEIEDYHTFLIDNIVTKNTAKSTSLAARMLIDAVSIKYLKQMYVSPTIDQTKLFSNDRVRSFIEGSEFITKHYIDARMAQNVFTKEFRNGSKLYLRYALHDAEKLRGFSIDKLYFDEVQSLKADVIDVTAETMNRSDYKKVVYSGTPLRSKGTLANIWHRSTMNEFAIKCGGCGHWNILDEKNIGATGVICSKCGSDKMESSRGQWVSSYSISSNKPAAEGFRICALHFANAPWVDWQRDIIHKMENRSQQIFYNETLALEFDGGSVPITREELYRNSSTDRMTPTPNNIELGYPSVGGIDYGPSNSTKSNTVLVILQRRPGHYLVTYAKKFLGKEAEFPYIHEEVPKILHSWKTMFLAADYGMGEASNGEIRKKIGPDKLIAFQHVNSQKNRMQFNDKMNAYTLNRTEAMTSIFNGLKSGVIRFKSPLDMDKFFDDILSIYAEFDEELGTMRYENAGPDDFFHALLFAIHASDAYEGETMLIEK